MFVATLVFIFIEKPGMDVRGKVLKHKKDREAIASLELDAYYHQM